MKRTLMLVLLLAVGNGITMASIIGDAVTIQYLYPTIGTLYGLSATGVVTAGGVTLNVFSNASLTVLPDSVQLAGIRSSVFLSATFNGVSIQDLTHPLAFAGFSVDPATTIAAFNIADVSLSTGFLFINYQGLSIPLNSLAQVDFTTSTSSTPESSTVLVSLLGLCAISWRAYAKRERSKR